MGRRLRRSLLFVVLLAGIAGAVRAVRRRTALPPSDASDAVWPPLPESASATSAWVEPEDGTCPLSHPVKAKVQSGIFHAPGSAFYERTRPDRCYRDVAAAEADGLRAPRR